MIKRIAMVVLACILGTPTAHAQNLVINGDFSAGASGFSSTYSPNVSLSTANQGSYAVVSNPTFLCNGCFPAIGDHTTGSGNMLFIDSAGTNPDSFWSQTFSVAANTEYDFSLWATSLGSTGPIPALRIAINGMTIFGPTSLGNTTGATSTTWKNYKGSWSSGATTSATLELFSANLGYPYNDLAVDDISLVATSVAAAPEPGTWALMIIGFGAAGVAMRRSRKKVTVAYA